MKQFVIHVFFINTDPLLVLILVALVFSSGFWPYLVFCASKLFSFGSPRFGSSVERGFKGGITPKGAEGALQK